jgi:small subunit ribosomal protein S15
MLTKTKKANAIKETQLHKDDTGSAAAQVSILTRKIDELAKHLKKNHKDNHSRRGLLGMVADRQKHLNYLERKAPDQYAKVVKKVGLKNRMVK